MNKTIVITGGSDGLGKTLTEDLAKDNKVIILSNDKAKLQAVAKENNCDYFFCDVSNYYEVEKTMKELINKYPKIDVLINNAGIWIQDELDQNEADRIKRVIEVNLLGTINMIKTVIPNMKINKEGLIININSQNGINFKAERSVYGASKWGVTGLTKSLQIELAKYGIRVTDVMPGLMKTDLFKKANVERNIDNGLNPKEAAKLIRFIIDTPKDVFIPEVGIKNINY